MDMKNNNNRESNNINIHTSSHQDTIFQLPLRVFSGLQGYAYLILSGEYKVLIDTGSGFGESNHDIEKGFDAVSDYMGRRISLQDLTHIFITHGHIDHFGGLNFVRSNSNALVGIHELDRRIITNYEERLTIVSRRLEDFFIEAGVGIEQRKDLIQMYKSFKILYTSGVVDFTYNSIGMRMDPFTFVHVPGHSPGHVVIKLHDILFSGDHVLEETSPHQAPEQITLSTGLDHYLQSLEKIRPLAPKIRITLGGHEQTIFDLDRRLNAIRDHHYDRLQRVLDLTKEPKTISQVSEELFGDIQGYHEILALEETGAHVEYLHQRGLLSIANLKDVENDNQVQRVPIEYQCTECKLLRVIKKIK
jgi:glyoxylase-like metal-dependent hydrolase (beta-lactamase superfamily II)